MIQNLNYNSSCHFLVIQRNIEFSKCSYKTRNTWAAEAICY